jgi:hypothetical protein
LSEAGWDLLPHQWQHNMLLLIPGRHTTLTTSVFLLLKGNSYPFIADGIQEPRIKLRELYTL